MIKLRVNFITGTLNPFVKDTGLATAYREQKEVLESLGVEVKLNSMTKCDITHIHYPGPSSYYWMIKSKAPVIITAHTVPGELKCPYEFEYLAEKFGKYYLGDFYNKADIVIAPTNFTKIMLHKLKIKKPIEVISNGINLQKYTFDQQKRDAFRKKYKITSDEKIIYSVGMVSSRKGFDKFIAISKKMNAHRFVWIGKNCMLSMPKKQDTDVKDIRYTSDNLIRTGYVPDIISAHSAGDIFLFPSHFETQGLVALEAAACSRPIIVEDAPSFDWIENLCLRAKTINDYCAQIEEIIMHYEKHQKYSEKLAKENDIYRTGREIIKVYERALSNHN